MNSTLRNLPVNERIRLVEDLWDSIASDQLSVQFTSDQHAELEKRLKAFQADGNPGRPVDDVIREIRSRL